MNDCLRAWLASSLSVQRESLAAPCCYASDKRSPAPLLPFVPPTPRSLKASNVLLSADLRACIGDLGVAQVLGSCCRSAAGFTHVYAAPEQLLGQHCTLAADVYSLGVLIIEASRQAWPARA